MTRPAFGHFDAGSPELHRSARRGASKNAGLYVIDGEYHTIDAVMARLNMTRTQAQSRISVVRKKPGPLTWAKLGVA